MMSPKEKTGTIACLERYDLMCEQNGAKPIQDKINQTGINHAYWMTDILYVKILSDDPTFDDGKVGRWLGFIQRELILAGYTTVQRERDFSRPYFKTGK